MARPKNLIPQARRHSSGQSRVTIDGKDHLLGPWGSPQADEAYRRIVAQWLAKEGPFAVSDDEPLTIEELTAAYWLHAEKYYGYDRNPSRGDCHNLKAVIAILNRLYASLPANKFTPLELKAIRAEMIRKGWSRSGINHSIGRLKRIFSWAVEEVIISPAVWHALLAVKGLKKGRTEAIENPPVRPIDIDIVEATKQHLRPALRALIDFTLLTGCRPNAACQLRPIDIDKSNADCWIFRPQRHKTENYNHPRLILIGPKAQAAIVFFWPVVMRKITCSAHAVKNCGALKIARQSEERPTRLHRWLALSAPPCVSASDIRKDAIARSLCGMRFIEHAKKHGHCLNILPSARTKAHLIGRHG